MTNKIQVSREQYDKIVDIMTDSANGVNILSKLAHCIPKEISEKVIFKYCEKRWDNGQSTATEWTIDELEVVNAPFNLAQAIAGEPIQRKDGTPVKFIGYSPDVASPDKVVVVIGEEFELFKIDGRYFTEESDDDLEMV